MKFYFRLDPKAGDRDMRNYNVKLDEKQIRTIIKALDLFTRIKVGQIKEVGNVLRWALCANERSEAHVSPENMEIADRLLDKVQMLYFPELGASNASYSIRSAPGMDERIAYDIEQVLRNRIEHDDAAEEGRKPQGVWSYTPWACTDHPLPQIEKDTK